MHVEKKVLGQLDRCYALAEVNIGGAPQILVASEPDDRCLLFNREGQFVETVWEHPGGVMSMVAVPGREGMFLSVQRFYSFDDAQEAVIVAVTRKAGTWQVTTVAAMPFVHRIEVLEGNGCHYLVACQLKSGQEYVGDWRFPGRLLVAELTEELLSGHGGEDSFTVLQEGLFHNHGCTRCVVAGEAGLLIASDEGVLLLKPPLEQGNSFRMETLLQIPASEAALWDLDGDGLKELCVITPFHGDGLRVYHQVEDGYREVYRHPESLPFLHGFFAGSLNGQPVVLTGCRGGERKLYLLRYEAASGKYGCTVVDEGRGPANLLVLPDGQGNDVVFAANRETGEIALYRITW